MSAGAEPIELLDLVSLKVDGPTVIFIKVSPEAMTKEYIWSISKAMDHVLKAVFRGKDVKFLVVPKDIDLAVLGDAQLEQIGYARIPAPATMDLPEGAL